MPRTITDVLSVLVFGAIGLLPWSMLRAGAGKDKIVFVRSDPTVGVQSIQQITDPNEFAATNDLGVSKDRHDAPQFQATSARDLRKNELGLMNPDGSGIVSLHVSGTDPSLSPDGAKIAYCSLKETQYSQIFVMNVDGTSSKRLTTFGSGDACGPVWSRDGKKIAFYAFAIPQPSRNPGIWVMDADGTNQKKLTARGLDPAWSPDDRQIAFASNREGAFQVYVMNSDGSSVQRLTKGNNESSNPACAPDGAAIVYSAATEGDRRALFLMGRDGADPRRLAFSKHQDFCFPGWSRDGNLILFTALNRVGPQGIVVGEDRPRCEQWTGEYQIFTLDAEGKTRRLTDSKLAAMRASYGQVAPQ